MQHSARTVPGMYDARGVQKNSFFSNLMLVIGSINVGVGCIFSLCPVIIESCEEGINESIVG